MSEPQFPAVGISGDSVVSFHTRPELARCTWKALESGYYNSLRLFDAQGVCWLVSRVTQQRPKGLLNKLVGGRVQMDLEFDEGESLDFGAVQDAVVSALRMDVEFWESRGSFEELLSDVMACGTVGDLAELLT